jgi:hypothetical protein
MILTIPRPPRSIHFVAIKLNQLNVLVTQLDLKFIPWF